MHDHWHERLSSSAMGRVGLDGGVASRLHARMGVGESSAFVRRRRDPRMRRIVVGKFAAGFQPGGEFAGSRYSLGSGRGLAAVDGTISRGRYGVHVGCAGPDLRQVAIELSSRASLGIALGLAKDRIRPPRSGIAGGDCGGASCRLAVFALGVQYELCVPRSSLSSLLGTCSPTPRCDFCWSGRASLLADASSLELDVSGGGRR